MFIYLSHKLMENLWSSDSIECWMGRLKPISQHSHRLGN